MLMCSFIQEKKQTQNTSVKKRERHVASLNALCSAESIQLMPDLLWKNQRFLDSEKETVTCFYFIRTQELWHHKYSSSY